MRKTLLVILITCFYTYSFAQAPRSYTSSEVLLQLKKLNTIGSVLYIAAHPDDENTRLLAYLANEKCLRTGYLSLTRGDGGQNLIGPEQGIELGVIRTQELLAARRIDGGEQFFTRAYDFGFSKSPEETLKKWNKDSVLADMVWVIRLFRPDIIITRFATDGSGGHGHHTTSAILAEEAFEAAGDPNRFPEQLQYTSVWQPRRLFWNVSTRFQNPNADMSPYLKLDVGGYNPLLGKSYGEIAAESRSMHKSQGFGSARQRGEYYEYFKPLKGDTAGLTDIFSGLDLTWNSIPNGKLIGNMISKTILNFDAANPYRSLPALINIQKHLGMQQFAKQTLSYQHKQVTDLMLALTGTYSENIAGDYRYSSQKGLTFYVYQQQRQPLFKLVKKDSVIWSRAVPNGLYWLNKPIKNNLFQHPTAYTYGNTFLYSPSPLSQVQYRLYTAGNTDSVTITQVSPIVQYKWVDPEKGELYRPVVITPPIMINPQSRLITFTNNATKELRVLLKAGQDSVSGIIKIALPQGWNIVQNGSRSEGKLKAAEETNFTFSLNKKGEEKEVILLINPNEGCKDTTIVITAVVDGKTYTKGYKEIKYDHIPVQTLFPEAEIKLVKINVQRKLKRIGYIPGAGDEVQNCLTQLGYEVITLTDDKLAGENLAQYEAIITGVRAYNTNDKLPAFKQKLMDYVAQGGNLVVQYNTNSWAGPLSSEIGPYPFKINRNRITDEEAQVKFLLPEHPVLNTPNKITESDFEGWIQERSIYHAGDWDSNYVAPLSMSDPYEMTVGSVSPKGKPDQGALIIAKHGKGHFVYTGLVFFRQLPAGVPGAYRLLVNLLEIGK